MSHKNNLVLMAKLLAVLNDRSKALEEALMQASPELYNIYKEKLEMKTEESNELMKELDEILININLKIDAPKDSTAGIP